MKPTRCGAVVRVTATPVLLGVLVAQFVVIALFFFSDLGFLWCNVVGSAIIIGLSFLFELLRCGAAPSFPPG